MDEIIEKVGNFGIFQAFLFASTSWATTMAVSGMMLMMYGSFNPGWTCHNETSSMEINKTAFNNTIAKQINGISDDVCTSWRQCSNVVYDTSSSTVLTEWNLMCDNAWIPSLVITIQMCGVLVGSWLCGPLGDRLGRKICFYGSLVFHGVANLICVFSTTWQMFATAMFFVGVGVGGILTSGYIYPMEFVGSWWRPVLSSVPMWTIGLLQFSLIVYVCRDWKNIHLVLAVLTGIFCIPAFWIPESMRWLAVNGKEDKMEKMVQRIARWNKKPPVGVELIHQTAKDIAKAQAEAAKPTYLDLFKTVKLRRYSIKFGLIWIIMSLVYYMISFGIKSFSGDFYVNMIIFTITDFPAYLCIGPIANKIGRRFGAIFFFTFSALFSFGVVVFDFIPGDTADNISLASAIISKTCLSGAWTMVSLLGTEVYPTVVRNLQSGYVNAVSRFGSIAAAYMIPADNNRLFLAYSISGALLLTSAGIIASVSDTKGKRMADTVKDIESRKKNRNELEEAIQLKACS